jgi:hypothetical protein
MSLTETQIESLECCLLEKVADTAAYSNEGRLTPDKLYKTSLFYYQVRAIRNYIPNGTLLTEGFISSASLDFSGFTSFGLLLGNIIVDGVAIAILPEATYADLSALVTGVVTAINASGSGYTADDAGDPTLGVVNLYAPGPGTEANGFIVTVVINPYYQLADTLILDLAECHQMISVNDPASAFYGKTFVTVIKPPTAILREYYVYVVENDIVTNQIHIVNGPGQFTGIGAWSLVHDSVNDRIYVAGYVPRGKYSYIDTSLNLVLVPGTANPPIDFTNEVNIFLGATNSIYNPVNDCKYFICYSCVSYNIRKLDSSDTQTTIGVGVATTPQNLAVDPGSGNLWVQTPTAVHIFNTSNALVLTVTNPGETATDITYCADTNRMLVGFKIPGIIKSFLMNGTIDNALWYNFGASTGQCNVFYSSIFNVVFTSNGTDTAVLSTAGVLKNNILGEPSTVFCESVVDKKVISNFLTSNGSETITTLRFFNLGNTGTDQIDGAMEGGTPDVFMNESLQCVAESDIIALEGYLKRECGCEDCGNNRNGNVIPPPITPTVTIYYGTSALDTLDSTEIQDLTGVIALGYAGSYTYDLVDPDEFEYIAWPASLGTPSRFYDPVTNLDIAMYATYQVTINSIIYNVARTYYAHGGGYTLTLTA